MWHHHRVEDLRGDLHVHTAKEVCETHLGLLIEEFDEACGHIPLNDVVNEARDRAGMTYIGITNHSSDPVDPEPNRAEANERVRRMVQSVREYCRHERGIKIFTGAEVNILPDGTLDVDDEVLEELDYVVASMHYLEGLDAETIQVHYLQALQHPHVRVIGHLNRHIHNVSEGRWDTLVAAAAHFGCALEFNIGAQLTNDLLRMVKKYGTLITLGSDAHRSDMTRDYVMRLIGPKMEETYLEDALRRLTHIPKEHIVNFWDVERVTKWLSN